MIELKDRLVPGWRESWRWLSVQLSLVAGAIAGWVFADPIELLRILSLIPPEVRTKLSPLVTIAVVAVVVGARLWKQNRKPK